MMPSTPRSNRRRISDGSSMVQAWTARPSSCARSTNRFEITGIPLNTAGACTASPSPVRRRIPWLRAMRSRIARGPNDVHSLSPYRDRARASRLSEKEPIHTRSNARAASTTASSGKRTSFDFASRLNLASGKDRSRSSTDDNRPLPWRRTFWRSAHRHSEILPDAALTRSIRASWKATTTPSAVS